MEHSSDVPVDDAGSSNGNSVGDRELLIRELSQAQSNLASVRKELSATQRKLRFLRRRDKAMASTFSLILTGPHLARSMRAWLKKASHANPFPRDEVADVLSSLIARFMRVGVLGFVLANVLLLWQNLLIQSQNGYFREQAAQLREQIDLQRSQGRQELRLLREQVARMQQEALEGQRRIESELEQRVGQEVRSYFEFRQAVLKYRPRLARVHRLADTGLVPRSRVDELQRPVDEAYAILAVTATAEVRGAAFALRSHPTSGKFLDLFDEAVAREVGSVQWHKRSQAEVESGLMKNRRTRH